MEATRSLENWRIKVEHDKIDVFKASIKGVTKTLIRKKKLPKLPGTLGDFSNRNFNFTTQTNEILFRSSSTSVCHLIGTAEYLRPPEEFVQLFLLSRAIRTCIIQGITSHDGRRLRRKTTTTTTTMTPKNERKMEGTSNANDLTRGVLDTH
ncbi:hypothetical protein RUM43_006569 [Polyplax serrata]|uniref:Uncharacterized protein n=1 Tax=Polyplax serrata TaxID=468196 RepID=A0AAN8S5J1_POLSC